MIAGYRRVLAVLAVAIFSTNVSNYTERYGLIPLVWIAVFAGLCVPLVLNGLFRGTIPLRPLVWWGALYVLVSLLWFYRSPQDAFAYGEVRLRVLSVLFIVLSLIAFSDATAQRTGRAAVAWATMLGVGLNVYELFNPGTFSTVVGRSAGLFGDSNQSAAALVLGLILAYGVVPGRLRLPFVALTAVGVFTTFSRAGILGWLLVVAFLMLRAGVSVAQIRRVVALSAIVAVLLVSPLFGTVERELTQRGTLNADVLNRINFLEGNGSADSSTTERNAVAAKAWALVGEEPVGGHGTGASLRIPGFAVGTHNTYLALMVDHGFVVGILLIPLLLLATLWGATGRTAELAIPLGGFIALWSAFSHTVLEDRYLLLAVGLTASVVALERRRQPAPAAAPAPPTAQGASRAPALGLAPARP